MERLDKGNGKVAVLGGINIKVEGSVDLFQPLLFKVIREDSMKVFGDPNLTEDSISFMHLTDLLGEYTNWTRDEIKRKSRFEDEKLT